MAFQFIHLSWAGIGRTSRRSSTSIAGMSHRSGGWSVADLVAEADRELGACAHVANPQAPIVLHGCSVRDLVPLAQFWAAEARTISGGKYRKNQPCLAAGVFSCPREKQDIWPEMRDAFIEDLRTQHGDRLKSVVEHIDEAHPHVHFYLVPKLGEDFGRVHPGYRQRQAARSAAKQGSLDLIPTPSGKKPRGIGYAVGAAFRNAMREWQDGISERVCKRFGLERLGPRRKRQTRYEHKLAQKEASAAAAQARADAKEKANEEAARRIAADREQHNAVVLGLKGRTKAFKQFADTVYKTPKAQLLLQAEADRKSKEKAQKALVMERQARVMERQAHVMERQARLKAEALNETLLDKLRERSAKDSRDSKPGF
jgi:hypothetical protein